MKEFFAQNWGNLIVGVVLLVIVAITIRSVIRQKRSGKCGCGCSCCDSDHCRK